VGLEDALPHEPDVLGSDAEAALEFGAAETGADAFDLLFALAQGQVGLRCILY
jgi:hypothetical protein